jgi:N-methylhydantoinase A
MVAMRTITVERGYDPREFTLVPFGGMGPTIAGMVAAELGIGRILIPRDPGTFSAHGMLVTDAYQERSLTRITSVDVATPSELDAVFAEMEALQEQMRGTPFSPRPVPEANTQWISSLSCRLAPGRRAD